MIRRRTPKATRSARPELGRAARSRVAVRRRGAPLPRWQRNRAAKLHSACRYIHKLRERGLPMVEARRRAIDRFDGAAIGDGRVLTLSVPTIERHFYRWMKAPARAHFLKPATVTPPDPGPVKALVVVCIREGITLREAYTRTAAAARWPFCYETALHHARAAGYLELIAQRLCLKREAASLEARSTRKAAQLLRSLETR